MHSLLKVDFDVPFGQKSVSFFEPGRITTKYRDGGKNGGMETRLTWSCKGNI